jgi:uncharacterized NAD(P)/FAD-binding protein YdhS
LLDGSRQLRIVQGECIWIGQAGSGIAVLLADGCRLVGDVVVCATGHDTASAPTRCYADPWIPPRDAGIAADAAVLILGTGLTMIDYALSLLLGGHRGPIIAMSRRGLVSRAHRRVQTTAVAAADVPFGAEITVLLRWLRRLAEAEMAHGGDWRSVVDAIRPFTHEIWRRLSVQSKRRFLEHARAWWDVHRHRMAPEAEQRIAAAIAAGALTIVAGKICPVEAAPHGALVHYRRRGERGEHTMQVAKIVECTGIIKNPNRTAILRCAACWTRAWPGSIHWKSASRSHRGVLWSIDSACRRSGCSRSGHSRGRPSGRSSPSPTFAASVRRSLPICESCWRPVNGFARPAR